MQLQDLSTISSRKRKPRSTTRLLNLTGCELRPSKFVANYLSDQRLLWQRLSTGDSALYALPRFMATGNTIYFKVNLPTSLDGAIDDLTGDWIDLNTASGPGMNSQVDSYINAEPHNAPTGIVFTDFADLQPGFVQDIYLATTPRIMSIRSISPTAPRRRTARSPAARARSSTTRASP